MATLKSTVDVEAACHTVIRSLGYSALKPEQLRVIKSFVLGKDVFAVLPTGFGKSLATSVSQPYLTEYAAVAVLYSTCIQRQQRSFGYNLL